MNTTLIVIISILVIGSIIGAIVYFQKTSKSDDKPSTTETPPDVIEAPTTTETPIEVPSEAPKSEAPPPASTPQLSAEAPTSKPTPVNAVCIGEIEDSFYTFSNTPVKGSEILKTLVKEPFALSSSIVVEANKLIPTKNYTIGRRIVSNTKSGPLFGGTPCPEFPSVVYKTV